VKVRNVNDVLFIELVDIRRNKKYF